MQPSKEEIKIAEKVKFWEEQEKINGVLVERILHLNKEITALMAEKELDRKVMEKVVSQLKELSEEILVSKERSTSSTNRMNGLENSLNNLKSYIEEMKNSLDYQERGKKQLKGIRAVHVSFYLSIVAILLSAISLFF